MTSLEIQRIELAGREYVKTELHRDLAFMGQKPDKQTMAIYEQMADSGAKRMFNFLSTKLEELKR